MLRTLSPLNVCVRPLANNWFETLKNPLLIANWIAIALFCFTSIILAIANPNSYVLGALNLVPFGCALIAFRRDSKGLSQWVGLLFNGLWTTLYLGVALVVLAGLGGKFIAIPIALVVAMPCAFNTFRLWRLLHPRKQ